MDTSESGYPYYLEEALRRVRDRPDLIETYFPRYLGVGCQGILAMMKIQGRTRNYGCLGIYTLPTLPRLREKFSPLKERVWDILSGEVIEELELFSRREKGFECPNTDWERTVNDLQRPLMKEELVRRRYFPSSSEMWRGLGPRFGPGFTVLSRLLTGQEKTAFFRAMDIIGLPFREVNYEHSLRGLLKWIEAWAKRNGDFLSGWKGLVALHTLGGFLPAPPDDLFVDNVKDWVSIENNWVDPLNRVPGWKAHFSSAVRDFCKDVEPFFPTYGPLKYLYSLDWARAGAADYSVLVKVRDTLTGEEYKVRASKDLASFSHTPEDFLPLLLEPVKGRARAMVKRETTKSRAVLVTDLGLYLKMSWISYDLERVLRHVRGTSLFFTGRKLSDLWIMLAERSESAEYWKLPVDQSKFDHNVSLPMIDYVLSAIKTLLLCPTQRMVLEQIRTTLVTEPPPVMIGDHKVPVHKGILSGWRWTALLDTWINYAEVVATLSLLKERRLITNYSVQDLLVQGDDVWFQVRNPSVAIALCEGLRACGFDINPAKTWFSVFRDEYLRQVGQDGGCSGYLTRTVSSLMWRNPIKPAPYGLISRVNAIGTQWRDAIGRGASVAQSKRCLNAELRRIGARFSVRPSYLITHLSTPTWAGGLGLTIFNKSPLNLVIKETQKLKNLTLSGLAGLFKVNEHLASYTGAKNAWPLVAESVVNCLQPFQDNILKDPSSLEVEMVEIPVPRTVPIGISSQITLPPVRARFRPELWGPKWMFQLHSRSLAREGKYSEVDKLLDTRSSDFSPHIRRNHGKSTWISWLDGSLDLPVRSFPGWSPVVVGGQVARAKSLVIRRGLASCLPYRGSRALAIARTFWLSQRDPIGYIHHKPIGG